MTISTDYLILIVGALLGFAVGFPLGQIYPPRADKMVSKLQAMMDEHETVCPKCSETESYCHRYEELESEYKVWADRQGPPYIFTKPRN